jgi:Leucine-rich repeat (LRR) protein
MFAPLQGLKRFCCDHNSLVTEGIPWETLARLPKLSHQIMDNNRLTSLPSVFGQASALRVLKLSANALTALPESLGSLGSLEELHVSHNQLEELPEQLGAPFWVFP